MMLPMEIQRKKSKTCLPTRSLHQAQGATLPQMKPLKSPLQKVRKRSQKRQRSLQGPQGPQSHQPMIVNQSQMTMETMVPNTTLRMSVLTLTIGRRRFSRM